MLQIIPDGARWDFPTPRDTITLNCSLLTIVSFRDGLAEPALAAYVLYNRELEGVAGLPKSVP